jgi:hypothetical protein
MRRDRRWSVNNGVAVCKITPSKRAIPAASSCRVVDRGSWLSATTTVVEADAVAVAFDRAEAGRLVLDAEAAGLEEVAVDAEAVGERVAAVGTATAVADVGSGRKKWLMNSCLDGFASVARLAGCAILVQIDAKADRKTQTRSNTKVRGDVEAREVVQ